MAGKFHKFLKKMDIFGHVVQLNFNAHHKSHNTIIGGLISIIIQFCLLTLTLDKCFTLFSRGDNSISSFKVNVDLSTEPGVNYNST